MLCKLNSTARSWRFWVARIERGELVCQDENVRPRSTY
jgi:hypothetical protein